jgi:hypothetical protein
MIVHITGGPYDGRSLNSDSDNGDERRIVHDFVAFQKGVGSEVHVSFTDDNRLSQSQIHTYEMVGYEPEEGEASQLKFEYRGILDWRK